MWRFFQKNTLSIKNRFYKAGVLGMLVLFDLCYNDHIR
jgi:hypothetical protein